MTSSDSNVAKTSGLHLLCDLADLVGSKKDDLWAAISPSDADALFTALPRVVEQSHDQLRLTSGSGDAVSIVATFF